MQDFESLRQRLDEHYDWPAVYTFKFIVPRASSRDLLSLFESDTGVSLRESRGGKYLSLTATVLMPGSESVIAVYEAAAAIEGIISL